MYERRQIDNFIALRADKKTYEQIIKKLHISKPTLVRWGKMYAEEIKAYELNRLLQIYAENLIVNETSILIKSNWIKRLRKDTTVDKKRDIFMEKIIKGIEKAVGRKLYGIQLSCDKKTELFTQILLIFMSEKTKNHKSRMKYVDKFVLPPGV